MSRMIALAGTAGRLARPLVGSLRTGDNYPTAFSSGQRLSMQELFWDQYEPTNGSWGTSYISGEVTWTQNIIAAGYKHTLALGVDWTPAWAFSLNGANYVNQNGDNADQLNVIFSQPVRDAVAAYYTRIASDFDLSTIWAIRITSGGAGEMLYPDFDPGLYWAYDANAQNGPNRPPTMAACPFPGWRPGSTSITTAQVGEWLDWYIGALVDVTEWQMNLLDSLGFRGYYQILCPGSGTRPSLLAADVAGYLTDGTPTCVGAVWHKYWDLLTTSPRTVVYQSSMSDLSGDDVLPQPEDAAVALTDPVVDDWCATRWTARIAKEHSLRTAGENAGYDRTDLQSYYEDSTASGMMTRAFAEVDATDMVAFYWAHDDQLYDGTVAAADFFSHIAALGS